MKTERAAPAKPRCDFFGAGARGAGGESDYDEPHDVGGLSLPRYYWSLRVARVCLPSLSLAKPCFYFRKRSALMHGKGLVAKVLGLRDVARRRVRLGSSGEANL